MGKILTMITLTIFVAFHTAAAQISSHNTKETVEVVEAGQNMKQQNLARIMAHMQ